jgi:hypothetical protein
MPKKVPHNCFQCSKLSNEDAQAKPCWDADRCPNRRHYQRNKGRISQERRVTRSEKSPTGAPRAIEIDIPTGTAASIIFYRERQDAPVHAIAAEVWQGGSKALVVDPMHCLGLSPAQVVKAMAEILQVCSKELGVDLTRFAHRVELHPSLCPIKPCPLCHSN